MSFKQVKLGDIFDIARGGSPRPIDDYITDDADGLNWISIKDASNSSKYIFKTEKKIKKEGLSKSRYVEPDDFLLTNSMSFGRPYIMKTSGCIHDGWLVLKADKSKVDIDFFYHLLSSDFIYRKFTGLAAGAVVKNLNTELVRSVEVPLPPLEEQRRIASILDKADAIRQKRQQAIVKLDELLQATFIDMFGDESNDYKGIDKVNLLDKVDFLTGFAFKSNDFKSSGIKLCRGINVLTGYLDWNSTAYWDSSEHDKFKKFELKKDDIVIAMDRPWISSGFKISMIGEEDKDILLVQRVARLRSKESSYSNFIYHLLDSHNFKNHCNVTETTIPHISPTDFKTFLIPDASQSQILKFDKFAKAVRAQKQAMRISLEKSNDFFNSLQQKAFNGTL